MAWTILIDEAADHDLERLDQTIRQSILQFLHGRVAKLENPRSIGEALRGRELGNFWKYRVGDYRIISSIEDRDLQIFVVRVGNRREVHKSLHSGSSIIHAWQT